MWEFISTHIFTILGVLGGLGAIGIGIAVFVFGIPAMLIIYKAIDLFKEAVKFFSTPLGQAIGIVLLCILCFVVGDMRRVRLDAAEWDRRVQAAEAARQKRDAEIKQKVAEDANKRIDAINSEKNQLEGKVAEYEKTLLDRPGCRVTADDLKRLR